jgi:hypothetical protein
MLWQNEQVADSKPMQIFYCPECEKYQAAETPALNLAVR